MLTSAQSPHIVVHKGAPILKEVTLVRAPMGTLYNPIKSPVKVW
jgi:hypothetical protein